MFPYEPDKRDKIEIKSISSKFMTFASASITFCRCCNLRMTDFQICSHSMCVTKSLSTESRKIYIIFSRHCTCSFTGGVVRVFPIILGFMTKALIRCNFSSDHFYMYNWLSCYLLMPWQTYLNGNVLYYNYESPMLLRTNVIIYHIKSLSQQ